MESMITAVSVNKIARIFSVEKIAQKVCTCKMVLSLMKIEQMGCTQQCSAFSDTEQDLTSSPIIRIQPRGRTDRLFDKVTLMCSADGNPDPVIRWYKDGVALEGPQSVGGVYTIDRIKPEDRGTYHCQASNTVGTAMSVLAKVLIEGDT